MRRGKESSCGQSGTECDFNAAQVMAYNSPDGKKFQVRRLVCAGCGERVVSANRKLNIFANPKLNTFQLRVYC